ncbi:MAG: DUF2029 domain-containing protein [Actinobacteria bacterium]|nr:DUF2029 domain-containing protein [Actinomycetota bacterium]
MLPVNPCDPLDRPANYPSIWLFPSHLGLGPGNTVALGVLTACLFFSAALVVIPRGSGACAGVIYALALCSPSVMLGVERGNADLLIFALIVLTATLLRRSGGGAFVSPLLLLFAAILKLFPILAAPVLLRLPGRRGVVAFGAVILGFGVYALATLGTIREIQRVVPQTSAYSYGIKPLGSWASNLFAAYRIHLGASAWDWIFVGIAIVAAMAMQPWLWVRLRATVDKSPDLRDLDFFVMGALIYVTTFSLFESFEYRLVFVLLTIPQMLRWTRARRALGFAGVVLVQLTLWLGAPWFGVPVVHTLIDRWLWLTSRRPFVGADQPLSAAVGAQALLGIVLVTLLVAATLPRLSPLRKHATRDSEETGWLEHGRVALSRTDQR